MVARRPRIVIVGAGMAGLTAAHRLRSTAGDLVNISVLEAGERIGGRIFTSDFAGDRVEIGATWIHGIGGSPIYAIANDIGALSPDSIPYERMDGFPEDPVTVAEGGDILNLSMVDSVSSFYKSLMDSVRAGNVSVTADSNSVGSFLKRGIKEYRGGTFTGGGDWTVEAAFGIEVNTERTYTSADDLFSLDLAAEREYKEFPGEQITIAKGYSRVIEHLASILPEGSIQLSTKVHEIEWCVDGHDGPVRVHVDGGSRVVTADHLIVTVSLGVLKASLNKDADLVFSPALPGFKKEAIGRLGFGVVDKLFMEMEMDGGDGSFPNLQLAFHPEEGHVEVANKIPRWMRRTASICPVYGGSRVLLAWFAGEEARGMEDREDNDVIDGVHATLDAFPSADVDRGCRKISRVRRSEWAKNPLFLGSYSYVAVGSSGDDLDLMAEPLPRGNYSSALQILFAGEATHRTHYSTTHGAYFSGIREANRLLQYYSYASNF